MTGNAAPVAYITVAILTATTYTFGGLMREQVCIYMCPWPRIQAAMLDENSLVVTYNDWRGEPRGRHAKKAAAEGCAGGLRRLQCLCRGVPDGHRHSRRPAARMHHLRTLHRRLRRCHGQARPATRPDLLRDIADYADNMALARDPETGTLDPSRVRTADGGFIDAVKHFNWRIIFRPRSLLYMGVWSRSASVSWWHLLSRDRLEVNVLHDRNPQFVLESNGDIRNGYSVKILNMIPEPRVIFLSIEGLPGATMRIIGSTSRRASPSPSRSSPTGSANSRSTCTNPRSSSLPKPRHSASSPKTSRASERDVYTANFHGPETK
jgi:polyferredoxin